MAIEDEPVVVRDVVQESGGPGVPSDDPARSPEPPCPNISTTHCLSSYGALEL